jgi:hypothetical protein
MILLLYHTLMHPALVVKRAAEDLSEPQIRLQGRNKMPKEYLDCVKSVEDGGKSHKDAQKICAIQYYKKHGKTPNQAESAALEGVEFSEYEVALFEAVPLIDDAFAAVWTTAYMNNLPDSAFLYVEPGEKDKEGKTVPRSKRHFPYKDASGKVDLPHLRNALARIPQSNVSAEAKAKAIARARKLLGSAGGNPSK